MTGTKIVFCTSIIGFTYENGVLHANQMFEIYPNSSNGFVNIMFDLDETAKISLELYTPAGNRVIVKTFGQMPAGYREITLHTSGLEPGMYYCKLITSVNSEYYSTTRKININ